MSETTMLYKFVGGEDDALADIFDKAVVDGSLKFGAAWAFNDPFEFKFTSVPPASREAFEAWHQAHAPDKTPQQRDNAWDSFFGGSADWNTEMSPRINLLGAAYVLCLAQRWNSHLMWAHYARSHRGFVIRYKVEVLDELSRQAGYIGQGPVAYRDQVPELHWFSGDPNDAMGPVIGTKSTEWAYEEEYRVVLSGPPGGEALFRTIDPNLIDGVILGARAPEALIRRAIDLRRRRQDFSVDQALSRAGQFGLVASRLDDNTRVIGEFL